MNEKAWIDDKISRFSYLNSYTIYWGDGIWCENGSSPTYRKWASIADSCHNCIFQRLENFVISASAPRARFLYKVCVTAQKMRVGPSESACRSRLQSTSSCCGQKPWWWALRKRFRQTGSVVNQRDERKRTIRWGVENLKTTSKLVAISTPG